MTYEQIINEWNKPLKEHVFWTCRNRKLTAYEKRQALARELAGDWSYNNSPHGLSWHEYCKITDFFYEVGKRYGLLREFRENGIC